MNLKNLLSALLFSIVLNNNYGQTAIKSNINESVAKQLPQNSIETYESRVLEKNGKFYEFEYRANGVVHFKTRVELYFADGVRYRTNIENGMNEEFPYKTPHYRYHGKRTEFDESGIRVVNVSSYKHGVLRKKQMGLNN